MIYETLNELTTQEDLAAVQKNSAVYVLLKSNFDKSLYNWPKIYEIDIDALVPQMNKSAREQGVNPTNTAKIITQRFPRLVEDVDLDKKPGHDGRIRSQIIHGISPVKAKDREVFIACLKGELTEMFPHLTEALVYEVFPEFNKKMTDLQEVYEKADNVATARDVGLSLHAKVDLAKVMEQVETKPEPKKTKKKPTPRTKKPAAKKPVARKKTTQTKKVK